MNFYSPDTLILVLTQTAGLLVLTVPALLLYGWLADRAVFEGKGKVAAESFGWIDAATAAVIGLFFLALITLLSARATPEPSEPGPLPDSAHMIAGIIQSEIIFLTIVGGFMASMKMRGISWREAFGLNRVGPAVVLGSALPLVLLALPLIATALVFSRVLLAGFGYQNTSPQDTVRFLAENRAIAGQIAVVISAVVLAPIQEELIFRGYLYGVLRRYAGPAVGIVVNAALFAAIHMHAPSAGGLFVLAVCLTLAYEWSGSIFVPMAMHAMFNSFTIIQLLAGGSTDG